MDAMAPGLCPKCGCPARFARMLAPVTFVLDADEQPRSVHHANSRKGDYATARFVCGGGHEWTPEPAPRVEPERFYGITGDQIARLQAAARRLYTEDRMNGDAMRDMAHALAAVASACLDVEIP